MSHLIRSSGRELGAASRAGGFEIAYSRPGSVQGLSVRTFQRRLAPLTAAIGLVALLSPIAAAAADSVSILVLRENAVGSAAQAQGYLDSIVGAAAKANGWSNASGKYHTRRAQAESYIKDNGPQFGIMSLAAFLGLRGKHGLKVVGKAKVAGAGGGQYFLVSKSATDLAGCKGKTLATNHAGDSRFVDKVVGKGAFKLSDFQVVKTRRPVQTLKAVVRGEAECALIDDAQLAERSSVDGAAGLQPVWKSSKLPPMVVVAFPSASAAQVKSFRASLPKICKGSGRKACRSAGIDALTPASSGDYKSVVAAY